MRRVVKWFVTLDVVAAAVIVAWLLFGWKTEYSDIGATRYYRTFGVYTRLALDASNNGRWDALYYFSRADPADRGHSEPYRYQEDRDLDGRYDVWVDRLTDAGGERTYSWAVDLDRDERPDWRFVESDSLVAYSAIEERRGY